MCRKRDVHPALIRPNLLPPPARGRCRTADQQKFPLLFCGRAACCSRQQKLFAIFLLVSAPTCPIAKCSLRRPEGSQNSVRVPSISAHDLRVLPVWYTAVLSRSLSSNRFSLPVLTVKILDISCFQIPEQIRSGVSSRPCYELHSPNDIWEDRLGIQKLRDPAHLILQHTYTV